jgi:mono/diheme cytochrome c family protein
MSAVLLANRLRTVACALVATLVAQAVWADDKRASRVPPLPEYTQECASCHLAFPPGLLPAASWRRVMDNLPRHYGTDASLDPALTRKLSAWLEANAGTGKRAREQPPEDRITRAAWFVREHDEVPATTWTLPAVKSPANCSACHTRAEQGDFSERHIRLPR